jgi:ABC-2 type transport system ATP-binding protein
VPETDGDLRRISVPVTDRVAAMSAIFTGLAAAGITVEDLTVRRPTLDEVFMALTGPAAGKGSGMAEMEVAA